MLASDTTRQVRSLQLRRAESAWRAFGQIINVARAAKSRHREVTYLPVPA